MKKSIAISLLTLLITVGSVSAVGISDIPNILAGATKILEAAYKLNSFAGRIKLLQDNNFTYTLPDSTQTITLSNQQKQELIGQYNALIKAVSDNLALMP